MGSRTCLNIATFMSLLYHMIIRYHPAASSPGCPAPVVEASDHAWISLQLSSTLPAIRGAIVTGASSGIGFASAMLLAENGYAVAACSRSIASLEAAFASAPPQLRCRIVFCTGDLSTEDGCRQDHPAASPHTA
jgi:hypothetical protein